MAVFIKLSVKFFDEQAGLRAMKSSYLGRQNSWVAIEKCETEIPVKKDWHLQTSSKVNFI